MKLVISKNGIKRSIETPFAMALGKEDLVRLGNHLIGLAAAMGAEGVSYTFVTVDPESPYTGPPNTTPMEWDDVGDKYR